jgi:hypothetical protein
VSELKRKINRERKPKILQEPTATLNIVNTERELRAGIAAKDAEVETWKNRYLALVLEYDNQQDEIARLNRVAFPNGNNPAESGQNEANVTERVSGPNANGVCEE